MKLPRFLTPHTVQVKRWAGSGAYGDVFGPVETLAHVKVEEKTKLVRDGSGTETASSAQVFIRPEHAPVPVDSQITLPSGRVTSVMTVEHMDHPPAPEYYVLNLL